MNFTTNYYMYQNNKKLVQKNYMDFLKKKLKSSSKDEYWNYSITKPISKKGFKIHLSGTTLNAFDIASKFFSFLSKKNIEINFKIISSLNVLELENAGNLGYSQIGKFITIYPTDENELLYLLEELDKLYKLDKSIPIPSDFKYCLSEVVYYRYGEFIVDPNYHDERKQTIPKNVSVPIEDYFIPRFNKIPKNYVIIEIISRTAKGGVYKALNIKTKKIVILKEAKNLADLDSKMNDAITRLKNEKKILILIEKENFSPNFYCDFYVENSYFIEIEYIEGQSLLKELPKSSLKNLGTKLANIFRTLNTKYKISYRDISFSNILYNNERFFLIDFEYSINTLEVTNEQPIPLYGTPLFYETDLTVISDQPEDIYGLVSLFYWSINKNKYDEWSTLNYEKILLKSDQINKNKKINCTSNIILQNIFDNTFNHKYKNFELLIKDLSEL